MAFCNRGYRCALALATCLLAATATSRQATARETGTSDRASRDAAIRSIPWRVLSGQRRNAVERGVADASLFRRLPTRVIDCDPDVFEHLVDHPELIVETWNLMGVSKVGLRRTGPETYSATDAAGGRGSVQVLHREQTPDGESRVLTFARGVYQAPPMPRPIKATTVLNLHAVKRTAANGRTHITADLDAFIRIDRAGAELVLRTLKPLVTRTEGHNFVETMKFVTLFSQTAERNPVGLVRMADRLQQIDDPTRREFSRVCHTAAKRSQARRDERRRLASAANVSHVR